MASAGSNPGTGPTLFRFNADTHEYVDLGTGAIIPHITGMLAACGWIDPRWYTDESRDRGHAVHTLTAEYDLGVFGVAALLNLESRYKGWLAAHVKAMVLLKPTILKVEEPNVHRTLKFGGRPDRVLTLRALRSVFEVKSGGPEPAHAIQTALQAILEADELRLPPEAVGRFALYLKRNGTFNLVEHRRRADFDEARRIIKRCCA